MRRSSEAWGPRALRVSVVLLALQLAGCAQIKACGYEASDRASWQQTDRVISTLELRPGARVADLGSGSGYFTFPLAAAVGDEGVVYAADVDEDINALLAERAEERGVGNVTLVLAEFADPKLPEPVDLIFSSNTFHHIEGQVEYFRNARRYLRQGGRIALIEYRDPGGVKGWLGHWSGGDAISEVMREAGYRRVAEHDFLERQHFLIFAPDL